MQRLFVGMKTWLLDIQARSIPFQTWYLSVNELVTVELREFQDGGRCDGRNDEVNVVYVIKTSF